jgi:uncharacterized protein
METTFPISGVHTYIWLPPLVAFCISFFTSMAGVSGAFLLLPFQMSVLGFVSPAVSATNLVFNIIAIPGGVVRFIREKRIVWPLTWMVIAGALPGVVIGGLIRLHWLPDPGHFRIFAGFVLLYICMLLIADIHREWSRSVTKTPQKNQQNFEVEVLNVSWHSLRYRFQEEIYQCKLTRVFGLSLLVGILGSVYGIGGAAIISPILVALYKLPIHTIAGATLMGTLVTSVAGTGFYEIAAPFYGDMAIRPDWPLGALFGLGGLCGIYLGARVQRFVPAIWLKSLLSLLILCVSGRYLSDLLEILF